MFCDHFTVPGSLTLKKEPTMKRYQSKRKVVVVPEILTERVELSKQSDDVDVDPLEIYLDSSAIEQEPMELLESIDQPMLKDQFIEMVPQTTTTTEQIEILEHKLISNPLTNTLSYTMPKTSLLVLTTDGNYVITKLNDNVHKTNAINISQPQLKEIIILNGNDLQLTNMAMNYQTIQQNVDSDTTRLVKILMNFC